MKIVCTKSPAENGITLLDVVVSTVLLSVGFIMLQQAKARGSDQAALQAENVRANQIIVEKIQAIRQCTWEQIKSTGSISTRFTEHFIPAATARERSSATTGTEREITYFGTISISNAAVAGTYQTDMKELTVALNWKHFDRPQTFYLTTFVSPNRMPDHF